MHSPVLSVSLACERMDDKWVLSDGMVHLFPPPVPYPFFSLFCFDFTGPRVDNLLLRPSFCPH